MTQVWMDSITNAQVALLFSTLEVVPGDRYMYISLCLLVLLNCQTTIHLSNPY